MLLPPLMSTQPNGAQQYYKQIAPPSHSASHSRLSSQQLPTMSLPAVDNLKRDVWSPALSASSAGRSRTPQTDRPESPSSEASGLSGSSRARQYQAPPNFSRDAERVVVEKVNALVGAAALVSFSSEGGTLYKLGPEMQALVKEVRGTSKYDQLADLPFLARADKGLSATEIDLLIKVGGSAHAHACPLSTDTQP